MNNPMCAGWIDWQTRRGPALRVRAHSRPPGGRVITHRVGPAPHLQVLRVPTRAHVVVHRMTLKSVTSEGGEGGAGSRSHRVMSHVTSNRQSQVHSRDPSPSLAVPLPHRGSHTCTVCERARVAPRLPDRTPRSPPPQFVPSKEVLLRYPSAGRRTGRRGSPARRPGSFRSESRGRRARRPGPDRRTDWWGEGREEGSEDGLNTNPG